MKKYELSFDIKICSKFEKNGLGSFRNKPNLIKCNVGLLVCLNIHLFQRQLMIPISYSDSKHASE